MYLSALQYVHLQKNSRQGTGIKHGLLLHGESYGCWFGVFYVLLQSAYELQTFT